MQENISDVHVERQMCSGIKYVQEKRSYEKSPRPHLESKGEKPLQNMGEGKGDHTFL